MTETSRVLTLVFTDLADSTALKTARGDQAVRELIGRHREHVTRLARDCTGRVIDWAGDGCFLTFETSSASVLFALRLQQAHSEETDLPGVRIGLHMGEVTEAPGPGEAPRIEGLAVDIAARIASLATPGQILMSSSIYTSARQRLGVDAIGEPILWQIHGTYELKGFDHPLEIGEAGFEGTSPLLPPPESEKCRPVSSGSHVETATSADWDARGGNRWLAPLAGIVIIALVAAVAYLIGTRETPVEPQTATHPAIELAAPEPVAPPRPIRSLMSIADAPIAPPDFGMVTVAISPDGSNLVYTGQVDGERMLVLRSMENQLETRALPGTEGAISPFFSPDSQSIAFFSDNQLKKSSIAGGSPSVVADCSFPVQGSWGDDNYILFLPGIARGVHRVHASGGVPERVTEMQAGDNAHLFPTYLPGNSALVYGAAPAPQLDLARVLVRPLDGREEYVLASGATRPIFTPTGHLLYVQTGRLTAQPFDLDTLRPVGAPATVSEQYISESDTAPFQIAVSQNGTFVYAPGGTPNQLDTRNELVWVDHAGNEESLGAPLRAYYAPRVSPDGTAIVSALAGQSTGIDIWILDISRGSLSRITSGAGSETLASWLPDGDIVFSSNRDGTSFNLYTLDPDVLDPEFFQLSSGDEQHFTPTAIPGDNSILFTTQSPATTFDIARIDPQGNGDVEILIQTQFREGNPIMSPKGGWMAYASAESGEGEIYMIRYPEMRDRIQLSTAGGFEPAWSPDGSEVYYRLGTKMMAVSIEEEDGALQVGQPKELFDQPYYTDPLLSRGYDVSPLDGRFLMIKELSDEDAPEGITELVVVTNWFEDLKQYAPFPDAN